MNNDLHARAQELLLSGEVSAGDERWVQEHLASCSECGALLRRVEAVRSALRSVPIMADPAMVEATRRRALGHARELAERDSRRWFLAIATAFSILLTSATVPLAWMGAEWLGGWAGWSLSAIVLLSFGVWSLPTILAAAAALAVGGERWRKVTWSHGGEL
jgi:anti-sigma factor RsiW